jgi:flagellar motor protein MotB
VIDYLSQRNGLPIQQLIIVGRGPSFPIADNNTPAGRAENRRIELVITPDTF